MANWAVIQDDPVFNARLAEKIIRPAMFVYLEWPSGPVFATTHHRTVTTNDTAVSPTATETWSGVGNVGFIEGPRFTRTGAAQIYKIGLASLRQDGVTSPAESEAIGRRAILLVGLADQGWSDWALVRKFVGHIITAGDFRHRRDRQTGNWLTDASIEISNGRSPRRSVQNHHSPETAENGDTAWRLLATAGRALTWPTKD